MKPIILLTLIAVCGCATSSPKMTVQATPIDGGRYQFAVSMEVVNNASTK